MQSTFKAIPSFNMADAPKAVAPAAPKATKPKAPRKPAAHPPMGELVVAAILALKERMGSSVPAIKKYIAANAKVGLALDSLKTSDACSTPSCYRVGSSDSGEGHE